MTIAKILKESREIKKKFNKKKNSKKIKLLLEQINIYNCIRLLKYFKYRYAIILNSNAFQISKYILTLFGDVGLSAACGTVG